MQIVQMPNRISLSNLRYESYASRQRALYGAPQHRYLIDTMVHPKCKANPRQARLCSAMGHWEAPYGTNKLGSFKTSGRAIKGNERKVQGRLPIEASFDDEFRSYQNIASGLLRRYQNIIERGCGENLREFVKAGVTAYAVGCTDEGLRKELISLKLSEEVEEIPPGSSGTSLKPKITTKEIEECILWSSIIFITILCTPQPTVVRWSSTASVSAEIMLQWKGFCALIANAYYTRGMAWLPVKTLQLEQMAVTGTAEEPAVVAARMRLVFATLEVVSPQWPRV